MSEEERTARMARWQGAITYNALDEADLIIEAVFEDMDVKLAVFAELDAWRGRARCWRPIRPIWTSTASRAPRAAGRRTGPAFFRRQHHEAAGGGGGPSTSPDTVATGFELARRLGKTPVRAGVCDGFINRILACTGRRHLMMQDGASPYGSTRPCAGYPMGPYQMADLAGGDIGWATRKRPPPRATRRCATRIPDLLCERGWFARRGAWLLYPDGARQGEPDPGCWP